MTNPTLDPDVLLKRVYVKVKENQQHFSASSTIFKQQQFFIMVLVQAINKLCGKKLVDASNEELKDFIQEFFNNNYTDVKTVYLLIKSTKKSPHYTEWKTYKEEFCNDWNNVNKFICGKLIGCECKVSE